MTEDERPVGGQEESGQNSPPWWYGGGQGMPDVESLLGPEGMQAVGGVAEEALKLFVVLRDRVNESGLATPPPAAGGWGAVAGQLAAGAVRAVNEFAASAGQAAPSPAQDGTWQTPGAHAGQPHSVPPQQVLPGQGAACAYCPFCQAIALFRSVPMSAWQRLATSVVEVADAVRDPATTGHAPIVVTPHDEGVSQDPIEDFLQELDLP